MVYFHGNQIIYRLNGLAPRLVLNERQQQVLNGLLKVPLFLTKPFHQIHFVFLLLFIENSLFHSLCEAGKVASVRREKWPQFDP